MPTFWVPPAHPSTSASLCLRPVCTPDQSPFIVHVQPVLPFTLVRKLDCVWHEVCISWYHPVRLQSSLNVTDLVSDKTVVLHILSHFTSKQSKYICNGPTVLATGFIIFITYYVLRKTSNNSLNNYKNQICNVPWNVFYPSNRLHWCYYLLQLPKQFKPQCD